jgi:hypothetical protein
MVAKTLAKGLLYTVGVLALVAVLAVSGVLVGTWFEHRIPIDLRISYTRPVAGPGAQHRECRSFAG